MPTSLGVDSRAVIGKFKRSYEEFMQNSWVNDIAMMLPSNQEIETLPFLNENPAMREWKGSRHMASLGSKKITITNKPYSNGLEIDVYDWRRDKTGQIAGRVAELAMSAGPDHFYEVIGDMVTNGTSTTAGYGAAYDAAAFFSASHAEGSSGTQSNLLTVADVPALDVTLANPTEQEMALAVLNTIGKFYGLRDTKGNYVNRQAKRFVIASHHRLTGVLNSALFNGIVGAASGNTTTNPLNAMVAAGRWSFVTPVAVPTFGENDLYIFRVDGLSSRPFIITEEFSPELEEDRTRQFSNRVVQYGVSCTRGFAYGDWRHAIKATLS